MTILLRRFAVCLALVLLLAPWPAEAAAPVLADRVAEISTTNGTGSVTLAGALAGHVTFGTAVGVGNTTYYAIVHKSGTQWEVGLGTLTDASTLARTLVYSTWTEDAMHGRLRADQPRGGDKGRVRHGPGRRARDRHHRGAAGERRERLDGGPEGDHGRDAGLRRGAPA